MAGEGINGGYTTYGTITPTPGIVSGIGTPWIYTTPTTMPMSGNSVTFTLISQAGHTKTATAVITLQ